MLQLNRVWKNYRVGAFGTKQLTAVRDVSFGVGPGEVVSLIGESGSGKTTIGRMVLRLNSVSRGTITFDGKDISRVTGGALRDYYRHVQGVFQDPFSSFNPIFKADRVFEMVKEQYFRGVKREEWWNKIDAALADVRLDPGTVLNKFPHQLSGGQLQRMLIARALLLDIKLLVADEVISMLDASTRIDVMNLLADLKSRGLGILFVTHDLALGNYLSATTVILRKGVVVEMGETTKVFSNPRHPYTKNLLGSVPQLHRKWSEVAAELHLDDREAVMHCDYHDRFPGECGTPPADPDQPVLAEIESGHLVACSREASTDAELLAA
jgi:oligopeptide/dipeptide ABC transporter ATP-binding protein